MKSEVLNRIQGSRTDSSESLVGLQRFNVNTRRQKKKKMVNLHISTIIFLKAKKKIILSRPRVQLPAGHLHSEGPQYLTLSQANRLYSGPPPPTEGPQNSIEMEGESAVEGISSKR